MPRRKGEVCKVDAMRKYLRKHPDASPDECAAEIGIGIDPGHFYKVRKGVRAELLTNEKNKKNMITGDVIFVGHNYSELLEKLRTTEKKLDEYRYRTWKNEGERFHYIERLKGESS